MFNKAAFLATAVAALSSTASAHYFFPYLVLDGTQTQMWEYVREHTQGYQPHFGFDILSSNDLRCNTGAKANDGTKTATVAAGDTIGFGTDFGAKIQHPGPIQVYMSKAPSGDVSAYEGDGDWFKIYELGPKKLPLTGDGSASDWGVYDMDVISFPIPKDVPSGQYLVRIEHLALHRPSGTEFYFGCAQVEVTGGGSSTPSDTIKFPGGYTSSDPGFSPNYSIYSKQTSYPYPGPSVFGSSGSSSSSNASTTAVESDTSSGCNSRIARGQSSESTY